MNNEKRTLHIKNRTLHCIRTIKGTLNKNTKNMLHENNKGSLYLVCLRTFLSLPLAYFVYFTLLTEQIL